MYKKISMILMGLAVSNAWANEAYRVAYSNKEDIGIYADNETEATWCQPHLVLRFQAGTKATEQSLPTLFPKLGKVFHQLCPQAETLTWHYVEPDKEISLSGETTKVDGWAFAPERAEEAENVVDVENVTDVLNKEEVLDAPLEEKQIAETTAVQEPVKEVSKAESASLKAFEVGGWKPLSKEERQELLSGLTLIPNQEGCKARTHVNFEGQEAYIRLYTEGVSCNSQGFLEGKGTFWLERSDGHRLLSKRNVWFSHGIPFSEEIPNLVPENLVHISKSKYGNRSFVFGVASQESLNSHYLIATEEGNYQGFYVLRPSANRHILTDKANDFKQSELIKTHIAHALEVFTPFTNEQDADITLVFIENMNHFTRPYDDENKLYSSLFYRQQKWVKGAYLAYGDWLNRQYGTENFVFERERQAAQKRAREEREQRLKKAREAEQQLKLYADLQKQSFSSPDDVQSYVYQNVRRTFGFVQLLEGKTLELSTLLQVGSIKDGKAQVIWPYPMEVDTSLEKGWYWVKAEQRLDRQRMDEMGLPLTLLDLTKGMVYSCKEEMCAELKAPLLLTRVLLNQADWTPESAQEQINQAN